MYTYSKNGPYTGRILRVLIDPIIAMLKKIAFASAGLLLLASPLLASAQTADDYGTVTGGYCPDLSTTFVRGATDASTNGQVTELQRFLTDYYDINTQNIIVGVFGRITQGYVVRFQREQGLPAFGIVGSMTRARIASVCGSTTTTTTTTTTTGTTFAFTYPDAGTRIAAGQDLLISWRMQNPRGYIYFHLVSADSGASVGGLGGSIFQASSNETYRWRVPTVTTDTRETLVAGRYKIRATVRDGENANTVYATAESPVFTIGSDPTVTVNEQCTGFSFTRNHRIHDVGGEVSEINRFLNVDTTGYENFVFSVPTFNTVDRFQRKYNLPVGEVNAGVWDAVTRAKANAINAQCVTPSSAGTLTVTTDPSTPAYQIAAGGTRGVTLGVFNVRATNENIRLTKFGLTLSQGSPADISQLYFYNSAGALLGTAVFRPNSGLVVATLTSPMTISRDSTATITVKADIASIGAGQPGASGDLIVVYPGESNTQGVGATSGTTITAQTTGYRNIPGVRIFKSYPVVADDPLPRDGLSDGRLLRFKIMANPTGSISVASFDFNLSGTGVTVSSPALYAYSDPSYSSPIGQYPLGRLTSLPNYSVPLSYLSLGSFEVEPELPVVIPAGQVYYFEVRATVSNLANTSTVVTTLQGDSRFPANLTGMGTVQDVSIEPSGVHNLIWSPNSVTTSHKNQADWTNGYGVPGLLSTGISQTRTGSGGTTILGTYIGYMNGAMFSTNQSISQADALANCRLNATNNPGSPVRCTWNGEEIFSNTPVTQQSCTFNGQTIAGGLSVAAYQASSVAAGQTCVSQPRMCENGSLSGSYQYASCTVQSGPNVPSTVNAFWSNMYSCVLGRAADTGGLNYWVGQTPSVGSLLTAYKNFYDSPEYLARGTSDTDYVGSLYRCVLFRSSDSGASYWVGQLQGGASRDSVLQNFISSAEFQGTQGPALRSATGLTLASADTQTLSQLASALNAIIAILNSLK